MYKDFSFKPIKASKTVSFYRKGMQVLLAVSLSLSVFQVPISAYAFDDDAFSSDPSSVSISDFTADHTSDPASNSTSDFDLSSSSDSALSSISKLTSNLVQTSAQVDFVYIDEVEVGSGDDQNVVVGFAEGAMPDAVLTLICTSLDDGQEFFVEENDRTDKSVLFTWGAANQMLGSYSVIALEYQDAEGTTIRIDLSPDDDESGAFDVVESFSLADDSEGGGDVTVYSIDESGEIVQSESVEEALDIAIDEESLSPYAEGVDDGSRDVSTLSSPLSSPRAASSMQGEFIIALDPGHGGSDPGASANDVIEKNVNLKIAQYCKAELEKTSGIKVVMTRASDVYVELEERVEYAVSQGADVFVSIHINAGGGTGFEIYYPNGSSYLYEEMHVGGQGLTNNIAVELEKLGLYNRGTKTGSSTKNQYYPDGSVADAFSVIRNSREAGLLGILIEHAFLDNASDANKLKDESFLKNLGVADATGILSYYADEIAARADTVVGTWTKDGDDWYFLEANGSYVRGFQIIGGKKYYFGPVDGDCKMRVYWFTDNGRKYWANSSGAVSTGWVSYGAKKWYLDPKDGGAASSGFCTVYGKKYYFDPDLDCTLQTDWFIVNGSKHWAASSGVVATGWVKLGGDWWYLDPGNNGAAASGFQTISGKKYYFGPADGDCKMRIWWFTDGGRWYWANGSGAVSTGWVSSGGNWWYLDPGDGGAAASGFKSVSGKKYYFGPEGGDCRMRTGWIIANGDKYWANSSGAIASGWKTIEGYSYYFDPGNDDRAATGEYIIDGISYEFDSQGRYVGYLISGSSSVTATQMAQAYKSVGKQYPSTALSKGGASSIETFCTIMHEEALAEGIRPEVVFVQAMNETGWLQFGGDVKIEQFNFCGLGATGNGVPGNSFTDVRTGIRAQVQHLKAYSSTEPLNNAVVDLRFGYVERGCAPCVEWLGVKENPYGKGWATSLNYGYTLRGMIASYFGI